MSYILDNRMISCLVLWDRDNFMSPIDAKEFGIVDHIVDSRKSSLKKG